MVRPSKRHMDERTQQKALLMKLAQQQKIKLLALRHEQRLIEIETARKLSEKSVPVTPIIKREISRFTQACICCGAMSFCVLVFVLLQIILHSTPTPI